MITREDAIQILTCIYDGCGWGDFATADKVVAELIKCFPEVDWEALLKERP